MSKMIVRIPSVNPRWHDSVEEFVLAFYRAVGWNSSNQNIDPAKVKMHEETWKGYAGALNRRFGLHGALLWMNFGPSGSECGELKRWELEIEDGAFQPLEGLWQGATHVFPSPGLPSSMMILPNGM